MSGNNLSLKDELLLLSSINKHRNSRIQKRLSYLEKESSSDNDNNNKPYQLQSRDDDTYFDVDDNSIVTEQVSCYRKRTSTTLKSNYTEPPSIVMESTASIRDSSGKDRDSPETIRTEFVATPRHRPSSTNVSQRHVNNYSPISIQTEMVSSRVQSNKHKKSIEKQQGDNGHRMATEEKKKKKKKKKTEQNKCNQDTLVSPLVKSSTASLPSNKSDSSISHVNKSSVSSSSTKQKSKSRSFFTRGKKSTASRDKKKKKQSQTNSKCMQLELNKKPHQSSTMQRKISDRYLKSNVGRDIVSIKEEEEVDDKVLMKIPPNKGAVDTSPSATTAEEVNIVVKQQNETSKKQLEIAKVKVAEQKRQEEEQQLTIYQKNIVSNKNKEDAQLTLQIKAKESEIAKQQAEAEIEKQRSIADELTRKEMAEQLKQLESSLANQNKVLSDKVELLMKDKMNTEEQLKITADMLSKYQNELEQVKADTAGTSTATSASLSSANKVEGEHADLKREVERIVQAEILRVNTESTDLVEDDPDTSDEQPVEMNLTTYTSYELEPSIVHATSNDDSGGGCFGWLCCSGGEENLDKSSWYDAESIDEEELPTGQCDSKLDISSVSGGRSDHVNDGSIGIRVV